MNKSVVSVQETDESGGLSAVDSGDEVVISLEMTTSAQEAT
tara:strand:+ start:3871 stop:3993 length:123 start_codon:yes stop_codon:yes gene_type:complete